MGPIPTLSLNLPKAPGFLRGSHLEASRITFEDPSLAQIGQGRPLKRVASAAQLETSTTRAAARIRSLAQHRITQVTSAGAGTPRDTC